MAYMISHWSILLTLVLFCIACYTMFNKKLGYRREAARCFASLNISLTHSRSYKVIRKLVTFKQQAAEDVIYLYSVK